MSPKLKKFLKRLSLDNNVPLEVIHKVIDSQFLFVKETMAEGIKNDPESFKTINLTHLGKFAKRDRILKKYKEAHDNRTEDID